MKASRSVPLSANRSSTDPHKLGSSAGKTRSVVKAIRDGHSANARTACGGMNHIVSASMGSQSSGNGTCAVVQNKFSVDAHVELGLANSMNGSAPPVVHFRTSFKLTNAGFNSMSDAGQKPSNGAIVPCGWVQTVPLWNIESSGIQGGPSSHGAVNAINGVPLCSPQAMGIDAGGDGVPDSAWSGWPGEHPVEDSALEVQAHHAPG